MNEKNLWTFVVDYDGGTYVSQFRASDIEGAISLYNSSDPSGQGAVPVDYAVKLDGLSSAYCTSGNGSSGLPILINIIRTAH